MKCKRTAGGIFILKKPKDYSMLISMIHHPSIENMVKVVEKSIERKGYFEDNWGTRWTLIPPEKANHRKVEMGFRWPSCWGGNIGEFTCPICKRQVGAESSSLFCSGKALPTSQT
jgi:hypothetical protein